jgi:hypothetical protein
VAKLQSGCWDLTVLARARATFGNPDRPVSAEGIVEREQNPLV